MFFAGWHDGAWARLRAFGRWGSARWGGHQGWLTIPSPGLDAHGVCDDAEDVGSNQSVLNGVQADEANDDTVDGGNHQSHPMFATYQDGGYHCKQAGQII